MQTTINVVDGSLFAILVGSIAFVISLAWNDAFHNLFMHSSPRIKKYGPWGYAIFVTIIGIMATQLLKKALFHKKNEEKNIEIK
jgi:hypothetical protein